MQYDEANDQQLSFHCDVQSSSRPFTRDASIFKEPLFSPVFQCTLRREFANESKQYVIFWSTKCLVLFYTLV
jgi:hypothetical protein